MSTYSIGVDLGGTNLRVAAVDANGQILHRVSLPAMFDNGPVHVTNDIVNAIETVRTRLDPHDLQGVGIGVPGFIDIEKGIIV
jgi:glucokinase